ncbi:MAG: FAD-dependent oxidoreductase [Candidatus Alcyoniella australis]|nr:FAD-dependent oxidoreductase [Candidatus Alcyoniella australis]
MSERTVIFGAGLAGLSAADMLSARGREVHIFERLPQLGGLARNVRMGGFTFDLGGHRFFSADPGLIAWLQELLGDDLLTVDRRSRIMLGDRFFDYPLRPANAMLGFGARDTARIVRDYGTAALGRLLGRSRDDDFESWICSRFGRALFEIYFRPYTEKTWSLPSSEISADWANTRIQLLSLFDAVRKALLSSRRSPRTYASQFFYPRGGIGRIAQALAKRVEAHGSVIHHVRGVERVRHENGRVRAALVREPDGLVEVQGAQFISSVPITELIRILDPQPPTQVQDAARMLAYRSLVCVFMIIDLEQVSDDTWIYFPNTAQIFGRSHEPRNWEREMSEPGMTSLCLEIFCGPGDAAWELDDKALADLAVRDLVATGLVARDKIRTAFIERVPDAYPLFRVGYERQLAVLTQYLSTLENLHPVGRTGRFAYLNMDEVVADALDLAGRLGEG